MVLVVVLARVSAPSRNSVPDYAKFLPPAFDSAGRANSHGWLVARTTALAGHLTARVF